MTGCEDSQSIRLHRRADIVKVIQMTSNMFLAILLQVMVVSASTFDEDPPGTTYTILNQVTQKYLYLGENYTMPSGKVLASNAYIWNFPNTLPKPDSRVARFTLVKNNAIGPYYNIIHMVTNAVLFGSEFTIAPELNNATVNRVMAWNDQEHLNSPEALWNIRHFKKDLYILNVHYGAYLYTTNDMNSPSLVDRNRRYAVLLSSDDGPRALGTQWQIVRMLNEKSGEGDDTEKGVENGGDEVAQGGEKPGDDKKPEGDTDSEGDNAPKGGDGDGVHGDAGDNVKPPTEGDNVPGIEEGVGVNSASGKGTEGEVEQGGEKVPEQIPVEDIGSVGGEVPDKGDEGEVVTDKVAGGEVVTDKVGESEVVSDKEVDGGVEPDKGSGTKVESDKEAGGEIVPDKGAEGVVDPDKGAETEIESDKVAGGEVVPEKGVDDKVVTDKGADGEIFPDKGADGEAVPGKEAEGDEVRGSGAVPEVGSVPESGRVFDDTKKLKHDESESGRVLETSEVTGNDKKNRVVVKGDQLAKVLPVVVPEGVDIREGDEVVEIGKMSDEDIKWYWSSKHRLMGNRTQSNSGSRE